MPFWIDGPLAIQDAQFRDDLAKRKMDEIDGTSLEQVAAAHDALDLSWLDEIRPPPISSRRFARWSRARRPSLSPMPRPAPRSPALHAIGSATA